MHGVGRLGKIGGELEDYNLIECILGVYWVYIWCILGVYWVYIGCILGVFVGGLYAGESTGFLPLEKTNTLTLNACM